ncbi:MAG: DUF885 family protein [Henriciella sp.]
MQLLHMFHTPNRQISTFSAYSQGLRLTFAALILLLIGPLAACSQGDEGSRTTRRAISQSQAIASDFLQTELALSPETASRLDMERRLGPSAGFALDNHSQAGFERRRLVRIELLQRLRHRPRLPEGHPLAVDLQIAEIALLDLISLEQFGYGRFNYESLRPYAIDPYSGIWIEGVNLLAYRQSITTADQARAFLARLRALSEALEDTKRRLIADRSAGIYLPRDLAEETQRRLALLSEGDPEALNLLATTFEALTRDVLDLELEQRQQMVSLVRTEIEQRLRPAYKDLISTLTETSDEFSDQTGISAQPNGLDLFIGILKSATGTGIPVERLHARHVDDVERHSAALTALLVLPLTDEEEIDPGPERLSERLAWFENALQEVALADVDPASTPPPLETVSTLGRKTVWNRIVENSDFKAQSEANSAYLRVMDAPYFLTLQAEEEMLPQRTLIEYPAIVEAWRLYIWTRAQPTIGPLEQIARARIRLIQLSLAAADTGIHLERWTLPEATEFIALSTGLNEPLSRQLALTIMARPGYHSSIVSTFYTVEALSERAKAVLGERYSETDFQRALIQPGPRPLPLIEKDIEEWYGERLAN